MRRSSPIDETTKSACLKANILLRFDDGRDQHVLALRRCRFASA
jgi:hypothetical protein